MLNSSFSRYCISSFISSSIVEQSNGMSTDGGDFFFIDNGLNGLGLNGLECGVRMKCDGLRNTRKGLLEEPIL